MVLGESNKKQTAAKKDVSISVDRAPELTPLPDISRRHSTLPRMNMRHTGRLESNESNVQSCSEGFGFISLSQWSSRYAQIG